MGILSLLKIDILEDVYFYNLKTSRSPLLSHYREKSILWTLLYESLSNEFLLKLMLFNTQFNIAPLHTFTKYYENELVEMQLNRFEKQCIGYHVATIFTSLGFKNTRKIYRKGAIIKYAAFFSKESQLVANTENGSSNGNS